MNRTLLFIPIFVISLFLISSSALADVALEDLRGNIRFSSELSFNTAVVETGNGNIGDFEIIACSVVDPNEVNNFTAPSGTWVPLDTGDCGGSNTCIGGIWSRFAEIGGSQDIACNWTENNFVFAGGSIRLSGVDGENPIIGIDCEQGAGGNTAVAPSINTEAGSAVVRIFTFRPLTVPNFEPFVYVNTDPLIDSIRYEAFSFNSFQVIVNDGLVDFFEFDGPTGSEDLIYDSGPIAWRACTIAIRMGTPPPPVVAEVPTLNEWGLIAFAALTGIAGFWFIRRRQITA